MTDSLDWRDKRRGWFVCDKRRGRAHVRQGPFSREDALAYARDLNDYVLRNAGITDAPFYAVHVK